MQAYTFNYIDVDEKQFDTDGKQLTVLKEYSKKIIILKSDKAEDVVLLKHGDHTSCVEMLLTNQKKLKDRYRFNNNKTQNCIK